MTHNFCLIFNQFNFLHLKISIKGKKLYFYLNRKNTVPNDFLKENQNLISLLYIWLLSLRFKFALHVYIYKKSKPKIV